MSYCSIKDMLYKKRMERELMRAKGLLKEAEKPPGEEVGSMQSSVKLLGCTVLLVEEGKQMLPLCLNVHDADAGVSLLTHTGMHVHARAHTRTDARTHAYTHTHTHTRTHRMGHHDLRPPCLPLAANLAATSHHRCVTEGLESAWMMVAGKGGWETLSMVLVHLIQGPVVILSLLSN